MIDQALDDMHTRIQETEERTVVDFMETIDEDHNKSIMKNALRHAMQAMLRLLMNDDDLTEAFEAAVIQVATSNKIVDAIASALVVSVCVMEPVAKFVATKVHKEVSSVSQGSAVMAPSSPRPSHKNSSPSDSKDEKNRRRKRRSYRKNPKGILTPARSMVHGHELNQ